MLKYFLILIAGAQFLSCHRRVSDQTVDNPVSTSTGTKKEPIDVRVLRATSQQWSGGAVGSGKGINYVFCMPAADTVFKFDSVWVDGWRLPVKTVLSPEFPDTLFLRATAYFGGGGGTAHNGPPSKSQPDKAAPPYYQTCAAILRIYINDQHLFHQCAPSIQVLPKLNYP